MNDYIAAMQDRVDRINRQAKAAAEAEQQARERALKTSMDYIAGIEMTEEPDPIKETPHA